jgi:hypothetical protein
MAQWNPSEALKLNGHIGIQSRGFAKFGMDQWEHPHTLYKPISFKTALKQPTPPTVRSVPRRVGGSKNKEEPQPLHLRSIAILAADVNVTPMSLAKWTQNIVSAFLNCFCCVSRSPITCTYWVKLHLILIKNLCLCIMWVGDINNILSTHSTQTDMYNIVWIVWITPFLRTQLQAKLKTFTTHAQL